MGTLEHRMKQHTLPFLGEKTYSKNLCCNIKCWEEGQLKQYQKKTKSERIKILQ